MTLALRLAPRCYLLSRVSPSLINRVPMASTAFDERKTFWDKKTHPTAIEEMNMYWEKNLRLNRPQSPWLIYKLQFQSALSATHRATGLGMTIALWGIGLSALGGVEVQSVFDGITGLGLNQTVLNGCKAVLIWPFFYHAANGLRHLAWDTGRFFEMQPLYKTGYIVGVLSVVLAIAAGTIPTWS